MTTQHEAVYCITAARTRSSFLLLGFVLTGEIHFGIISVFSGKVFRNKQASERANERAFTAGVGMVTKCWSPFAPPYLMSKHGN
jgi:Ni,Fe-hydrogenase I cytochrome b subunit